MQTQDILSKEDEEKNLTELYDYIRQLILVMKLSSTVYIDLYTIPVMFRDNTIFALNALKTIMEQEQMFKTNVILSMDVLRVQIYFKEEVVSIAPITTYARFKYLLETAITKYDWTRALNEQRQK
jgi:hypothetical protein